MILHEATMLFTSLRRVLDVAVKVCLFCTISRSQGDSYFTLSLFLRDSRPCSLLAVVLAFLDHFGASARSGACAVP